MEASKGKARYRLEELSKSMQNFCVGFVNVERGEMYHNDAGEDFYILLFSGSAAVDIHSWRTQFAGPNETEK